MKAISIPFLWAAGPRVVLAYASEAERAAALARPQVKRTPYSLVEAADLEARSAEIRQQDYEFVADDFITGLAALGVPIMNRDGRWVAALSITNLTDRFALDTQGVPLWLPAMQVAAARLGGRMT